jgi:hypothetical protein
MLALDLENPEPIVEADLEVRSVRTADADLEATKGLTLDAQDPARPGGGERGSDRSGAVPPA